VNATVRLHGHIFANLTCAPNVHTIDFMRYLWDPIKQRSNLKKHHVEFADAVVALVDEYALTVLDEDSETEYRFQTLCIGAVPDVLMVVHTEEIDGFTTIISARLAEPSEREYYYEGIKNNGY